VASSAARTDVGRKRTSNEDAFVANEEIGLYAVADGMGGHAGGEVASHITAQTLLEFIHASSWDQGITWPFGFNPTHSGEANRLHNAVLMANGEILARAHAEPQLRGLGSTIVACMIRGDTAAYVNVGDSRLYVWRGGRLSQVTEDDSWAASMSRAGADAEQIEKSGMKHVLTRALGSSYDLTVEVGEFDLEPDDLLLMCSDGLYGPIGDEGIAQVLRDTDAPVDGIAQALIDAANAAGGPDNITVVLFRHGAAATATASAEINETAGAEVSETVIAEVRETAIADVSETAGPDVSETAGPDVSEET
jgi:serine/threonine protein phosphatase PrpC